MKAAYLGPRASFSHQAALQIFLKTTTTTESDVDVEVSPLPTFTDIFDAIQSPSSPYSYGVVPFENSSNGSVVQSLDLLADREGRYGDVKVCGEFYLAVRHQLLVKPKPRQGQSQSVPSSTGRDRDSEDGKTEEGRLEEALTSIEKFYTHPQVWGQCSTFLSRTECRTIVKQDASSTSEAARVVAESEAGTCAAIASELAGREYGLVTLAGDIEDKGDNTTRFFILARAGTITDNVPPIPPTSQNADAGAKQQHHHHNRHYKNLVSFTIDHEAPGALAEALSIFKKHGFNLTSINTRPSRLSPWHYIFFAECEQVGQDQRADAVQSLMLDLEGVALSCRHLGSWEDRLSLN